MTRKDLEEGERLDQQYTFNRQKTTKSSKPKTKTDTLVDFWKQAYIVPKKKTESRSFVEDSKMSISRVEVDEEDIKAKISTYAEIDVRFTISKYIQEANDEIAANAVRAKLAQKAHEKTQKDIQEKRLVEKAVSLHFKTDYQKYL
jgi:hypothetical protein